VKVRELPECGQRLIGGGLVPLAAVTGDDKTETVACEQVRPCASTLRASDGVGDEGA
jgi:hypothetical protein